MDAEFKFHSKNYWKLEIFGEKFGFLEKKIFFDNFFSVNLKNFKISKIKTNLFFFPPNSDPINPACPT